MQRISFSLLIIILLCTPALASKIIIENRLPTSINGSPVCTQANGFCAGQPAVGNGSAGYLAEWINGSYIKASILTTAQITNTLHIHNQDLNTTSTVTFNNVGIGTDTPIYPLDIIKNTTGIVRSRLKNQNIGSGVVVGALSVVENGHGIWGGMGMTGHATLQGGKFNHTFHLYNQGYGDSLYTIDGNKSHVWYTDPTDSHNFGFDEVMSLSPEGRLKTKSFELEVPVEEDLRFPVTSIKTQGVSNVPDYELFIGVTYALMFDDTTEEQGFITAQLPHGWKEGTDIEPHFHWTPTNTDTGNVTWCVEYTWSNIGDTFPSTSTECVSQAATGTAYDHLMAYDIALNGTGKTLSSILNMRIYRDATNDDYNTDAALLEFDIHYQNYRLGQDV